MRKILSVATLLGMLGVVSSFSMLWIGLNILQLDTLTLRTFIFLKLAVAGHMTIYLTRTSDEHFWTSPLPAPVLFVSAETTQLVATMFAVYGVFMEPIGWGLAGFVWAYALAFFTINNYVKVYFYKRMETWKKH
jgi:H+-transporting ATPase